jgi:hypothetical protein
MENSLLRTDRETSVDDHKAEQDQHLAASDFDLDIRISVPPTHQRIPSNNTLETDYTCVSQCVCNDAG